MLVPASFWSKIFLIDAGDSVPQWLVVLENAAVAPFVAAATFIGSMGNIPLATVLNANGVLFAGIMGFIYSDLMVPPLVAINAKYYGWRVALYIAGVMWVSIVVTAVLMHSAFAVAGITPESHRAVDEVTRFAVDYTFWLNLAMVVVAVVMVWLHRRHRAASDHESMDHHNDGGTTKRAVTIVMIAVILGGLASHAITKL